MTEKPPWPQGHYLVRITDAAVKVPEGGRVYDGTDRIDITFHTQITRIPEETGGEDLKDGKKQKTAADEEIPEYTVAYSAHLESADAGERKVVCGFSLQTSYPDHVKLDESTTSPDLRVQVKKAVLSVQLPDGTKRYGDPADMEHIRFEGDSLVRVSGFIRDSSGNEIVPDGFVSPQPDVDQRVLEQWSPIYAQAQTDASGAPLILQYKNALTLKKDPDGRIAGNPTENYEFCSDPADERFSGGTVTIRRAPVRRDVDYELKGEKDAYRVDSGGTVIVRAGGSLRAEPLPGNGYNAGAKTSNIRGDTTFAFRLEEHYPDGSLAADSEQETVSCRADSFAPQALTQINGASSSGGLLFSSSAASVSITVPEDDLSGLSSVRCRVLSGPMSADLLSDAINGSPKLSASSEWKEIGQNTRVSLGTEGLHAVEVEVRDQVGNSSLTRSPVVAIDALVPEIEITGVEDGSANASSLRIQATCRDPSYLPGSLRAQMSADFGGVVPSWSLSEDSGDGAQLTFRDFPRQKEADAVYHLTVTAQDRAGNTSRKKISFSVNRFGSSYSLADGTASKLKEFYHSEPFDVTFLETNLDKVGNARVLLRSGENMKELRAGSGLVVSESRTDRGVSRYSYTVPASAFSKDGTYEVMLLTTDRAGNSSDSSAQRLPVRFAIDASAPECLITGIQAEGRYKEKDLTAVIEVRDNLALEKAEIYVDSRRAKSWKADSDGSAGGIMKIPLSEKEAWQTVQVYARDKAGNEIWTKEIPVYISSLDPEKAQAYHSERLSAQQVQQIRDSLDTIRKNLMKSRVFQSGLFQAGLSGGNAPETGTVTNLPLLHSARKDSQLSAPSVSSSGRTEDVAAANGAGGNRFPLAAVLALAAVLLPASIGGILYMRSR